jgi:hypothetical protein
MALTKEELKDIKDKIASEFVLKDAEFQKSVQAQVDAAVAKLSTGGIKKEEFDGLIATALADYGTKATNLEKVLREQGEILNGLKNVIEVKGEQQTTLQEILKPHMDDIAKMRKDGSGFIRIDFKDIKNIKTVTSTPNSITPMAAPPGSPYAPGISTEPLSVYDIIRNPLFVSNYVDTASTDLSRMAWINETSLVGLPALVLEGAPKPSSYRTFQVMYSQAKKVADYIQITEEFDKDLNYLANLVKSLLQMDVARAYDLQIQADLIAAATQLNFTTPLGPNNLTIAPYKAAILDATYWDALFAMGTAVRLANFVPNVSLLNPITYGKMVMTKDLYGRYNTPPQEMVDQINPKQGNNVFADYALVGDLKQFKVFIYEDFSLKIGWINDDLIHNQYTIVSEVRFHDFISTARQNAIMYADAKYIAEQLNTNSAPIVGS